MYKQRFTRITGHITGSRWVVTGDLKNNASNVRASRNITDWMDVQKTDNIKLENKTTMWSTTSGTR